MIEPNSPAPLPAPAPDGKKKHYSAVNPGRLPVAPRCPFDTNGAIYSLLAMQITMELMARSLAKSKMPVPNDVATRISSALALSMALESLGLDMNLYPGSSKVCAELLEMWRQRFSGYCQQAECPQTFLVEAHTIIQRFNATSMASAVLN